MRLRGQVLRTLLLEDTEAHRVLWQKCIEEVALSFDLHAEILLAADFEDALAVVEEDRDLDLVVTDNSIQGDASCGERLLAILPSLEVYAPGVLLTQYPERSPNLAWGTAFVAIPRPGSGGDPYVGVELMLKQTLRYELSRRLIELKLPPDVQEKFERKAYELARLSAVEPTKALGDAPFVGAILVDALSGCVLRSGYRNQGVHAEAGLLCEFVPNGTLRVPEKSDSRDVKSRMARAVLFTTLEPCTKRGVGKTACSHWIRDAGVRRVVIGMLDPNRLVHGLGVLFLLDQGVQVDFFQTQTRSIIREQNSRFTENMVEKSRALATQMVEKFSEEARVIRRIWLGNRDEDRDDSA